MTISRSDFQWDGYAWQAVADLPTWRGCGDLLGGSGQPDAAKEDGAVAVAVARRRDRDDPLSDAEVALVRWLVDHEHEVATAVLEAVLADYPAIRDEWSECLPELELPDVTTVAELRPLVRLHTVHVHDQLAGDLPYLGFELECYWDEEHGLGVLTHGTRIVKVGGGDTAVLGWIVRRDAEASPDSRGSG
jgi:hypothetical protein